MTEQPAQTQTYAQHPVAAQPVKKKRRIFLWFFLAVQLVFVVWIFAGVGSADTGACGTLDKETCEAAASVGTGIGVFFIVMFWMVVNMFLGVGYGVYRLAKRV